MGKGLSAWMTGSRVEASDTTRQSSRGTRVWSVGMDSSMRNKNNTTRRRRTRAEGSEESEDGGDAFELAIQRQPGRTSTVSRTR